MTVDPQVTSAVWRAVTAAATNVGSVIAGFLLGLSNAWKRIIEAWWEDHLSRKKAESEWKPTRATFLIAEDALMGVPHTFPIQSYGIELKPATGFRALLVLTRIAPHDIVVTKPEARLSWRPWRLRPMRRVTDVIFQFAQTRQGDQAVPSRSASVNFFVQPPIRTKKPIRATVRLRNQYNRWQKLTMTFYPS